MKMNSIVSKVNLLVGILFIVVIVTISSVSYFQTKNTSFEYLRENHDKILFDVGYMFNVYEEDNKVSIQELSNMIAQINFNNSNEIFNVLKLAKEFIGFENVFFVTEDGIMYDNTGKKYSPNSGFDARTSVWYLGAKKSKDVFVSDPYKPINSDLFGISYSTPVYSDGKIIGVVSGVYTLQQYSEDILEIGRTSTSFVAVYSKDGTTMFHEDSNLILEKTTLGKNIAKAINEDPGLLDPDNIDTLFYAKDDAGKVQAVLCDRTINPNINICAMVENDIYTKAGYAALKIQFIIGILSIVIVLILVKVFASYLLNPINSIQTGLNSFFDFINHKTKDSA
ncbi:PDC sensor domain-containing protein, partial [Campylobacter insulaenigrae]